MAGFLNDIGLDSVEADPNYIPDGMYKATIVKSEIQGKKSGDGNNWIITYAIQEGAQASKQQSEWFDLNPSGDNEALKKSFLKKRVVGLGVPESKINEVDPTYFIGQKCVVSIKHKNGYQNVSDVRLADASSEPMQSFGTSLL
jgi:hypothetical protein